MQIPIKEVLTSIMENDEDWSWTEIIDCKEVHHVGLHCIHDRVEVTEDIVWCPDCKNRDMTDEQADKYREILMAKDFQDE